MPRLPRYTADECDKLLIRNGFQLLRTKGSHKIYLKNKNRVVIPFHSGKILHPKIIQQVLKIIEKSK